MNWLNIDKVFPFNEADVKQYDLSPPFQHSLVVMIPGVHPRGPGSIAGVGTLFAGTLRRCNS